MTDQPPAEGFAWGRYREALSAAQLARLRLPPGMPRPKSGRFLIWSSRHCWKHTRQSADWLRHRVKRDEAAYLLADVGKPTLSDLGRRFGAEARDIGRESSLEPCLDSSSARKLAQWLAADLSSPSQQACRSEASIALADVLAQLPEDQQTAVEMKYLQGCSVAAIAEAMERSEMAVGGLLRRGLKRLRELMHASE